MRWIRFRAGLSTENRDENREARRRRAERFITVARLILLWERIWPAMWPGMGIDRRWVMILALVGLFGIIPGAVHAVILLALFGGAVFVFWRSFARFRGPALGRRRPARRTRQRSAQPSDHGRYRQGRGRQGRSVCRAPLARAYHPAAGLGQRAPADAAVAGHVAVAIRAACVLRFCSASLVGFLIAGPQSGQRLLAGLFPVFGDAQSTIPSSSPGFRRLPTRDCRRVR